MKKIFTILFMVWICGCENTPLEQEPELAKPSDPLTSAQVKQVETIVASKIKTLQDTLNTYKGQLDGTIFKKVNGVTTIPAITTLKGDVILMKSDITKLKAVKNK